MQNNGRNDFHVRVGHGSPQHVVVGHGRGDGSDGRERLDLKTNYSAIYDGRG